MTIKQCFGRWLIGRLPITRALFDDIRVELCSAALGIRNHVDPWRRQRLRALRKTTGLLVNVACGPQVIEGFVNLDLRASHRSVFEWDCRRTLPFASGSVAGLRAEHFFEHLDPRDEAPRFLAEVRRVLQPGGVVRLIVPDAGRYLEAYVRGNLSGFDALAVPRPFPTDLPTRMDVINHVFHQWGEHRWAYDLETLSHRLVAAGFAAIQHSAFRRGLDLRLADDRDVHASYSLYVDARNGHVQSVSSTREFVHGDLRADELTRPRQLSISRCLPSRADTI